ncbi:NAD(P)H-dependent oxidoreductase, partial [Staphylococcus felis]
LTDNKALHIQARVGLYSEGPGTEMEHGYRYIKSLMGFYGVTSYDTVIIEGHNSAPQKAEEIKQLANQKEVEMGKQF